ncbi:hypothetical protein NA56DRAFT_258793 [Hyaloscypha hepaticicola]|uniref:Uncharacterized protein n=1 Tax=Hyaloscypha hepaticicola TaxID=2082293 RepID=A0A2J6PVU1_9HELO|nr:hypothetical protein NA56DRAFT_258793 [Hyaloscypha hepaticicola]
MEYSRACQHVYDYSPEWCSNCGNKSEKALVPYQDTDQWGYPRVSQEVSQEVSKPDTNCRASKCNELHASYSWYCQSHKCHMENCVNKKKTAYQFCEEHYTKITCINPKCDGQKIEGSHYCNNHICEASKCCLQRLPSYCYCRQHRCAYFQCNGKTSDEQWYCLDHECKDSSCFEVIVKGHRHCREHKK